MRKMFTDGRMDGGWYTKYRNLSAESDPGCYGVADFKACKTCVHIVSLW